MRINIFYVLVATCLVITAESLYLVFGNKTDTTTQGGEVENLPPQAVQETPQTTNPTSTSSTKTFPPLVGPLVLGMKSGEVGILQQMLAQDSKIYPEGLITNEYGTSTVLAVQRFQLKYDILPQGTSVANGFGVAGPATRTKLNQLYSDASLTPTTPVTSANILPTIKKVQTSSVSDSLPPSIPVGIFAKVVSDKQVNIGWSSSVDNVGVVGYRVYRNGIYIGTTPTLKYASINLSPETTYSFSVVAYDKVGNVSKESLKAVVKTNAVAVSVVATPSTTVDTTLSTTTPTPTPTPDPVPTPVPVTDTTPPTVPTGLSASVVSTTQINISWTASTDNVGVVSYKVFQNGTQVADISGTTYSSMGLTPSTSYSYAVLAYDTAGNDSAQSSSVSATTLTPAPTTAPKAYTVNVSDMGSPITPSSLTINVGDTVTFKYVSGEGEAKMRFTPSPPSRFTLDREVKTKSYTFTTAGTWTYNGGGPTATIIVE